MSDDERSRLCDRGLEQIFDPGLRSSIAELIDDVRAHGDDAVCRATARFDGIEVTPDRLRVSDREIDALQDGDVAESLLDSLHDDVRLATRASLRRRPFASVVHAGTIVLFRFCRTGAASVPRTPWLQGTARFRRSSTLDWATPAG